LNLPNDESDLQNSICPVSEIPLHNQQIMYPNNYEFINITSYFTSLGEMLLLFRFVNSLKESD